MTLTMRLWSTLLLILTVCECLATPAKTLPCRMKQPDGSFVTLRLQGDEYLNYMTTADGFTVVRNESGFWVYASKQADGSLTATDMVAHDDADRDADENTFLASMPKRLAPKMTDEMAQRREHDRSQRTMVLQQRHATNKEQSEFRGLAILVEYNDRPFKYGDETNAIYNDIFNKENYTGDSRTNYVDESTGFDLRFVGSVYDYYRDNSNGLFKPKFDVVGPVKIDRSQYYVNGHQNNKALTLEAANAADPLVDFSQYDSDGDGVVDLLYFVFSGYSSSVIGNDPRLIWPHEGVMYDSHSVSGEVRMDGVRLRHYACSTEMGFNEYFPFFDGIGTICHEIGHALGLPDLYDVDHEGSGGEAPHPGEWSLMATGADHMFGRIPSSFSLYERYLLGFCQKPIVLNEVGSYSLHEISTNEGFWLESPDKNEFFIIENRQQTGWDSKLPGHGMLVFRVDSNPSVWLNMAVNKNPDHMYYELLFAGGYQGSTSGYDPFPGEGNVTMLTPYTSPAKLRTCSGENCEYGIAHITETNGVITFDLVDASTFKEIIMPKQRELYEGFCTHLEPQIYLPTTQYETKWESDKPKVATVDSNGNVTAIGEGTAHVTLTADDITATCTVTVHHTDVVPDIESFLGTANSTTQVVQLNDAQVFLLQKADTWNRVFVRDATRSIMVVNFPLDVVPGDVLNGRMCGIYNDSFEWMSLASLADINYAASIQVSHGDQPQPDVVTFDDLDSHHIMDYIKMQGVSLDYLNVKGTVRLAIVGGKRPILLNATYLGLQLDLPSEDELQGNLYDVETVISSYNLPDYNDVFLLTAPLTLSETTGISTLPSSPKGKKTIYNLQGLRVSDLHGSSALPKGVYIVDGKKILIK